MSNEKTTETIILPCGVQLCIERFGFQQVNAIRIFDPADHWSLTLAKQTNQPVMISGNIYDMPAADITRLKAILDEAERLVAELEAK